MCYVLCYFAYKQIDIRNRIKAFSKGEHMPTLVQGTITLPDDTAHFAGASVYIYLENNGMMDMPAQVVANTIQHNMTYEGSALTFSVEGQVEDTEGTLNLRVHISTHHSDDVKKGDYVTKRAHHISADSLPASADIAVELV